MGTRSVASRRSILAVIVANLIGAPLTGASDGFGSSATGGAGGTNVTASTAMEFTSYVTSPLPYVCLWTTGNRRT